MEKLRVKFRWWFLLIAIPVGLFGGWGLGEVMFDSNSMGWIPVILWGLSLSFALIQIAVWFPIERSAK